MDHQKILTNILRFWVPSPSKIGTVRSTSKTQQLYHTVPISTPMILKMGTWWNHNKKQSNLILNRHYIYIYIYTHMYISQCLSHTSIWWYIDDINHIWSHEIYIWSYVIYIYIYTKSYTRMVQRTLPDPSLHWADLRCFAQPDAYAYACLNGTSGVWWGRWERRVIHIYIYTHLIPLVYTLLIWKGMVILSYTFYEKNGL